MNIFDQQLRICKKELSKLFPAYRAISHMATTGNHLYFMTYNDEWGFEASIRVNRETGLVQVAEDKEDFFAWMDSGIHIGIPTKENRSHEIH